ncbi:GxxExxY protein [Lutibacter sp. A64]|uniref:GxxExxY protein n=1 Tax=Lutibacter sp. A64 TaxID=2918526 RepID=UPI001F065047|nr:GxxExxY protein [Lutibacter sp. A64]UMB54351.1 GxxExxY protein [Lutibacter sp. A64]
MSKLLFEEESFKIIGACIEVHKKLGAGFLEEIYYEAIEKEFTNKSIPFEKNKKLDISYDGVPLKKQFTADFLCYNKILVVVMVDSVIKEEYIHKTLNYLKVTNLKLALLINFGASNLKWKRLIHTNVNH